jgi:hypothetical protein
MVALLTGVSTNRLASVSRLFVSPAARGRGLGLGTSLLAAVSSWTSAHDLRLMLDVVDDEAPAIKLYERIGWRLVDRRQADWVTPRGEGLPVRIHLAPEHGQRRHWSELRRVKHWSHRDPDASAQVQAPSDARSLGESPIRPVVRRHCRTPP